MTNTKTTTTATATKEAKTLTDRIAAVFNTAHTNGSGQLSVLSEALNTWVDHGNSVPIRLILTRSNGKKAKRFNGRPEKLPTYSTINRIVNTVVDKGSVTWKFSEDEATGMLNPNTKEKGNGPSFNVTALSVLTEHSQAGRTIWSKEVKESFPTIAKDKTQDEKITQRVNTDVKFLISDKVSIDLYCNKLKAAHKAAVEAAKTNS